MASLWSISGEWIVPVEGEPIRGGVIRGVGSVIQQVGPADRVPRAAKHVHLGGAAVLPGLVNAHAHLELSHLRGRLRPGTPMPRWLLGVLARRPTPGQQRRAVRAGVAEALATGTTAVADVSFNDRSVDVLARTPIRAVAFAEVMGPRPVAGLAFRRLKRRLGGPLTLRVKGGPGPSDRLRRGIAPHAPYSTCTGLYRRAAALARRRGWLIMTHLAETAGERRLLLGRSGPAAELLLRAALTDRAARPAGCTPVELARRLDLLRSDCILAHVHYVDDADLAILAAGRASVAYCPRSGEYFGRRGHRYADMLAAGVNVALGTDSLASNRSLDLLAEMRWLRRAGEVDAETILRMGTLHGAAALGWEDALGSLAPGKRADWIAVDVSETSDPVAAVLDGAGRVRRTVIAGRIVYDGGPGPGRP